MAVPPNPSVVLRRLHPWLGRAVHTRWSVRRSLYQEEAEALLHALARARHPLPGELTFRLERFLRRLHHEWFPRTWRTDPSFAEVLEDFRWWLGIAERWSHEPPRASRRRRTQPGQRRRAPAEPLAKQSPRLLRLLRLPPDCTARHFTTTWRRFLKANHPDLNPDQTAEERRRFAEAVALWRR